MIRWRPVAVGVAVALVVESVGYALTGRLSLFGGALGGAVAGWLVGREGDSTGGRSSGGPPVTATRGARVGLAVGVGWGVILAPVAVYLSLATGEVALFPYEYVTPRVGLAANLVLLALGVTLPPLVAGGFGATFRTVYTAAKTNRRHG